MKRILLSLAFVTALFTSCDDVQDNTPAFQGSLNEGFYKANDVIGSETSDGFIVLQGLTTEEIMTLKFRNQNGGTLNFGTGQNVATYVDPIGVTYSTNPVGSGSVTITENDTGRKRISGTFNFMAIIPGVDTLVVQNGNFFEAPYGEPINIDVDGGPDNAGTFLAEVNGSGFDPQSVSAVASGSTIVIAGINASNNTILLGIPSDAETGQNDLPSVGYSASYSVGGTPEAATSGSISIVNHDTTNRTIAGTFSFDTANNSITLGQFNVSY